MCIRDRCCHPIPLTLLCTFEFPWPRGCANEIAHCLWRQLWAISIVFTFLLFLGQILSQWCVILTNQIFTHVLFIFDTIDLHLVCTITAFQYYLCGSPAILNLLALDEDHLIRLKFTDWDFLVHWFQFLYTKNVRS